MELILGLRSVSSNESDSLNSAKTVGSMKNKKKLLKRIECKNVWKNNLALDMLLHSFTVSDLQKVDDRVKDFLSNVEPRINSRYSFFSFF